MKIIAEPTPRTFVLELTERELLLIDRALFHDKPFDIDVHSDSVDLQHEIQDMLVRCGIDPDGLQNE